MRNPCVDPKPGDVVIFGPQWQRERYEVLGGTNGNVIHYQMGPLRAVLTCTLRQWREWAKNGEVVR